jgi:hypothetical protein
MALIWAIAALGFEGFFRATRAAGISWSFCQIVNIDTHRLCGLVISTDKSIARPFGDGRRI